MKINSDINILGGIPDWGILKVFLTRVGNGSGNSGSLQSQLGIKTDKSLQRFQKAVFANVLRFQNDRVSNLVTTAIEAEGVTRDVLLLLFWNTSVNNELLHYLNTHVFFPSFYSGRVALQAPEVMACLKDLKNDEPDLKKWSELTFQMNASKYLTLLKKFGLVSGTQTKTIVHPYLNDKMFVVFVFWLLAVEANSNLLTSRWLEYCFSEKAIFVERVMQKKYARYFEITYTGENLKVQPIVTYQEIFNDLK
jgi:hypothetical protein